MRRGARAGAVATIGATALAVALLGGCAAPAPAPTSAVPKPTRSATPTPAPTIPLVVTPDMPADKARDVFDAVNGRTLSRNPKALGPDFVAALQAAGFPRAQLEVTADTTSVGLEAGSIQFAARWGTVCFLGQNGAGSGGYRSQTVPVLATGKCLIGATRPLG